MSFSYAKAQQIASALDCEAAAVLAVADVESGGRHDLPDGRPQILFEAQWFSKLTGHRYDASHPGISSPTWNRALYKGGAAEWDRLNEAMTLNADAALQSASWGLFQIMGFNYKACGFPTVTAFVDFIKGPDDADMEAFINFVKANPGILAALRAKDWQTFARLYNGPGAVASYSAKISDSYDKHLGDARPAESPPIPVADPTAQAKSPIASKTVLTTATAGVGAASVIAENVQPTIDAIKTTADTVGQAKGAVASLKDALGIFSNGHVMTVTILAVVVGCLLFVGWRYWQKARAGGAAVR